MAVAEPSDRLSTVSPDLFSKSVLSLKQRFEVLMTERGRIEQLRLEALRGHAAENDALKRAQADRAEAEEQIEVGAALGEADAENKATLARLKETEKRSTTEAARLLRLANGLLKKLRPIDAEIEALGTEVDREVKAAVMRMWDMVVQHIERAVAGLARPYAMLGILLPEAPYLDHCRRHLAIPSLTPERHYLARWPHFADVSAEDLADEDLIALQIALRELRSIPHRCREIAQRTSREEAVR
ncbi:MAG TPA: hypothetical protein VMA86_06085 [Acetobacteraceae bacterium]|nr:hypothetical protein [Acetobacteraceae bacterium]